MIFPPMTFTLVGAWPGGAASLPHAFRGNRGRHHRSLAPLQAAADHSYIRPVERLCEGLEKVLEACALADDPAKKRLAALWGKHGPIDRPATSACSALPAEVRTGIVGEVTAVCVGGQNRGAKTGGMTSRPIPTEVRAKLEQASALPEPAAGLVI
jgi:hypothetical protein